jgi:hypothetical protein
MTQSNEPTLGDVMARLDVIDRRVDGIDQRLAGIDHTLGVIVTTFRLLVDRIERLETAVNTLIDTMAAHVRDHGGE